ncbi:hypothetical protein Tco_0859659 [Tanacetum coccineum]|uniref:Reverse transcriptase domain-containing protein n=1 Tax=Tanacetum coccineum TaxID=301880 RepID=A0ABQ5BEW4_9ASTR
MRWDRFNDLLRACPHHGFSELHQLDTFYNALNINDQDSLNSAAGGNFLDKMPRECLKYPSRASQSFVQTRAKADKKNQASVHAPAPALFKAVELSCVIVVVPILTKTVQPLMATFIGQNISEYVFTSRFQANYNQNQLHRPQVNQSLAYQAPVPQTHSVTKNDFDNYVKANDAIMRNMQNNLQNQGQSMQVETNKLNNQMANLTDMLAKFVTANTASTSGSRDILDDPDCPAIIIYNDLRGGHSYSRSHLDSVHTPTPNHTQLCWMVGKRLRTLLKPKPLNTFVHEPPEVNSDLLPHLEYAFLEGKQVCCHYAKGVGCGGKSALVKPSSSNIKKSKSKIHDVIKKEVEKLLESWIDIYPIPTVPPLGMHKARLLRWVLLSRNLTSKFLIPKGSHENLASPIICPDLENPYENVNDPKEINEKRCVPQGSSRHFSKLATMDPTGNHGSNLTAKRSLTPVSSGRGPTIYKAA